MLFLCVVVLLFCYASCELKQVLFDDMKEELSNKVVLFYDSSKDEHSDAYNIFYRVSEKRKDLTMMVIDKQTSPEAPAFTRENFDPIIFALNVEIGFPLAYEGSLSIVGLENFIHYVFREEISYSPSSGDSAELEKIYLKKFEEGTTRQNLLEIYKKLLKLEEKMKDDVTKDL